MGDLDRRRRWLLDEAFLEVFLTQLSRKRRRFNAMLGMNSQLWVFITVKTNAARLHVTAEPRLSACFPPVLTPIWREFLKLSKKEIEEEEMRIRRVSVDWLEGFYFSSGRFSSAFLTQNFKTCFKTVSDTGVLTNCATHTSVLHTRRLIRLVLLNKML